MPPLILSAKEVKAAAGKAGTDAIPYPDLRAVAKREYDKQLAACKDYSCDNLKDANEIEAALVRAKACRQQRIAVRTVFNQAIGRVKAALKGMKPGDPLKPDLEDILKSLETSQKGHETAIDDVNNAAVNCEAKLKKLKT
jgi:hypothetical protein